MAGVHDGVHQTPDYQDEGIMFLSVENIATMTSEKYISEEVYERDYKVRPEKGDILMTRIGDVGTPNVVETDEKLAYYVSLALLKPNGKDQEVQEGWIGHVIPFELAQARYMSEAVEALKKAEERLSEIVASYDEALDELPEEEKDNDLSYSERYRVLLFSTFIKQLHCCSSCGV